MLMSSWIIFALVARLFMAMGKTVDQHIADAYGHRRIISAIVLQNVTAILSLCLIALFHGIPHDIDKDTTMWINIGVVSYLCAHYPYLKAMQSDKPRNVIPLFEMTPFLLTAWAFVLLGETMTIGEAIPAVLLVLCGFAFMWDFKESRFKAKTFGLMLVSSLLMALYFLSMRLATRQYDAMDVLWLMESGFFMAGLVMLIIYPRSLGNVKMALSQSRGRIILWEFLGGICFRLVSASMILALSLAPNTGLVAGFSGTQPLFVAALAILTLKAKPDWKDKTTRIKTGLIAVILLIAGYMYFYA